MQALEVFLCATKTIIILHNILHLAEASNLCIKGKKNKQTNKNLLNFFSSFFLSESKGGKSLLVGLYGQLEIEINLAELCIFPRIN